MEVYILENKKDFLDLSLITGEQEDLKKEF
ncbi:hypothetical protein HVS_08445 [Acetivibrio saccincola]|jgi:hypothetical protein|uniref:Uncharacterized protein n=1 Tax=Acetivibrio saccincola TaxID=1677857 RepID=A0A2K9E1D8_9FIRM|nr:hypothetical protein HVS_08445 [Acetivibrio saccincola]